MKRIALLFLFLLGISIITFCQEDKAKFLDPNKIEFGGSYCGNNLWNPGLKFKMEYQWKEFVKTKLKVKKGEEINKTKKREILFQGDVGLYWDPRSHVGAYTTYGIQYRKTGNKKFQYSLGVNPLGYYRSFLPETYEVNENGEVSKVFLPGNSYYAPSFSLGMGREREAKASLKAWYLNLDLMILYKYNANFVPLVFLEYGYRFNIKKKR